MHQRLAASGGDRAAAANLESRAASKVVWKERKIMARQREVEKLDRAVAAEAWTWKRADQMPIDGDFLSAKLGNGTTMEVPREQWAELAMPYYKELLRGDAAGNEVLAGELETLRLKLMREGDLLPECIPAMVVDTPCDPLISRNRRHDGLDYCPDQRPKRRRIGHTDIEAEGIHEAAGRDWRGR